MPEYERPQSANDGTRGFALVLGAGAATGLAYTCGVLQALDDVAGLRADDADLIIGTSAGAVVGADLRLGRSVSDIMTEAESDLDETGTPRTYMSPAWRSGVDLVRRVIGSAYMMNRSMLPLRMRTPQPPAFLQRAFPGSLATVGEGEWAARFPDAWPERRLWEVAWDLDAGRRAVLRADSTARTQCALRTAIEASCSVPGLYAPVRVGSRRLVDGGVQSGTNLDLGARARQPVVIGIAPMGFDPRRPPNQLRASSRMQFNAQLAQESEIVRRRARLVLFRPGGDELRHHGYNALSRRNVGIVNEKAYEATKKALGNPRLRRIIDLAQQPALARS